MCPAPALANSSFLEGMIQKDFCCLIPGSYVPCYPSLSSIHPVCHFLGKTTVNFGNIWLRVPPPNASRDQVGSTGGEMVSWVPPDIHLEIFMLGIYLSGQCFPSMHETQRERKTNT